MDVFNRDNLFKLCEKFSIKFNIDDLKSSLKNSLEKFLKSNEYKNHDLYNKSLNDIVIEKTDITNLKLCKLQKYKLKNICREYNIKGYESKNIKEVVSLIENHFNENNDEKKIYRDKRMMVLNKFRKITLGLEH